MAAISHNSNMGHTFTQLKRGTHLIIVKHGRLCMYSYSCKFGDRCSRKQEMAPVDVDATPEMLKICSSQFLPCKP